MRRVRIVKDMGKYECFYLVLKNEIEIIRQLEFILQTFIFTA